MRLLRHETVLAVLLAIALAVLATQNDRFFTVDNLLNQGRLMAEVGLVALVMTFVIVSAGIDLSVGSIFGLTAILLGVFWQNVGMPLPVAILAAVIVGTVAGLANGWVITRFRVPPLVATLATLALYRGLAEGISQARSVRGYPEWFFVLGQGEVLGVPTQLWLFVAFAIVAAVILGLSPFGRATYAVGSNAVAARFSGIKVDRTILAIYGASGLVSAIVEATEAGQRLLLAELAAQVDDPADLVRALWARTCAPEMLPFVRLFFECVAVTGGKGLTDPWIELANELRQGFGLAPDEDELRLGVAVTRGLLIDVLATGDAGPATRSLERFLEMWESSQPSQPSQPRAR